MSSRDHVRCGWEDIQQTYETDAVHSEVLVLRMLKWIYQAPPARKADLPSLYPVRQSCPGVPLGPTQVCDTVAMAHYVIGWAP
jgi:hypothetical protein